MMTANVAIVLPTHNRLEYTKKSVSCLLEDPSEDFDLYIWDNASTDDTPEYLRYQVKDPRIIEVILSKENVGATGAINNVWRRTRAELVGKVDNDCLVTPGWTRTFAQAHKDIPKLGVVACWHFFPEDFDYEKAKGKIQNFKNHQILRHPWTCGTGFLIKRETFERMGPIRDGATTTYWLKMAAAGYINGFYYPLIFQEHMDDPRSEFSRARVMSFDEAYKWTYGYMKGTIRNPGDYKRLHEEILDNLLSGPYDPKYYCGWRARLRRLSGLLTRFGRSDNNTENQSD